MKKLSIFLLACLCFSFFGCNNQAELQETTTASTLTTQEKATKSVPSQDSVLKYVITDENTLNEFTIQNIQSAWGDADEFTKEETAYKWYTHNQKEYIIVFCDENGCVIKTQFRCVFKAEVKSDNGSVFFSPCEGEREKQTDESLYLVSMKDGKESEQFEPGTIVQIEYDGIILESFPLQISAYSIIVCE